MKEVYPLNETITHDTLLEIAARRFPERKSYKKTFINGKGICINRNALFRSVIFVRHNRKKERTTLIINRQMTVLGALLLGYIWALVFCRDFYQSVEDVYSEELDRIC